MEGSAYWETSSAELQPLIRATGKAGIRLTEKHVHVLVPIVLF